ncbi:MAG TPA: hypothetical protein PK636_00535 [bacterium]|nr:hypothetical protein [bacterium]HPJ71152.1 hypothetical protein [bacterium]HPQ67051.1 hypothetical protein [bacterium]
MKIWPGLPPLLLLIVSFPVASAAGDDRQAIRESTMFLVSPVFGWNRDTLKTELPGGRTASSSETAPEYGLFFLMVSPHLIVNDFLFYTDVNGAEVIGNFLFANCYGDLEAPLTWNAGVGYLYHDIDSERIRIDVHVPLVKLGPVFRLSRLNLFVNPYIGYAWERVRTGYGNRDNDSFLYGLSLAWHWRMLTVAVKYYYQDSQEMEDNFQTFRARLVVGLTRHWGLMVRYDYMEHSTTTDQSFLFGPVFRF